MFDSPYSIIKKMRLIWAMIDSLFLLIQNLFFEIRVQFCTITTKSITWMRSKIGSPVLHGQKFGILTKNNASNSPKFGQQMRL